MDRAGLLSGSHLDTTTLVQVDIVGVNSAAGRQMNLRHAIQIVTRYVLIVDEASCSLTARLVQIDVDRVGGCVIACDAFEFLLGCRLFASTHAAAYQRLHAKTEYSSATRAPERRPARCTSIALFFERLFLNITI